MSASSSLASATSVAGSGQSYVAAPACRITILHEFAQAESTWRALEAEGALATPYQRYDWIAPWQRHVGEPRGVEPFIVVGSGRDGAPLFLWPLGTTRTGPIKVAQFLGGEHSNFKMAIWRRDVITMIAANELAAVLEQIGARSSVDLLALTNQPVRWDGLSNPLTRLPHQPSPSFGYRGSLTGDFGALVRERLDRSARRKMRQKQAALSLRGPVRYWRATNAADISQVIDAFLAQKSERMHELGLVDVFAAGGIRAFIETAAMERLAEQRPAIELYACSVGDTIVSTYAGVVDGRRFCGVFNSIIRNEIARESPGQLLMFNLVRMCCERGLAEFDLGVGEARFKRLFCNEAEPLVDSFLPLTRLGHIYASGLRLQHHIKRWAKHSPPILSLLTAFRRQVGLRRN